MNQHTRNQGRGTERGQIGGPAHEEPRPGNSKEGRPNRITKSASQVRTPKASVKRGTIEIFKSVTYAITKDNYIDTSNREREREREKEREKEREGE